MKDHLSYKTTFCGPIWDGLKTQVSLYYHLILVKLLNHEILYYNNINKLYFLFYFRDTLGVKLASAGKAIS